MKLIFRHFLLSADSSLSPALSPSFSLVSVILVMICIPVALGWSELVPADSTCQACWVRLDRAALFFLTPTLVCWQVIFLFSTTYRLSLPKLLLQNNICLVFFFYSSVYILKSCFSSCPNQFGYLIFALHAPGLHAFKERHSSAERAVHWFNKLCIKKHLWEFHWLYCSRGRVSFEFQTEWLPLVPKTDAKSYCFNHQKHLPAFWAECNKAETFYRPALTNSRCIHFCTFWFCYFAQAQQLTSS